MSKHEANPRLAEPLEHHIIALPCEEQDVIFDATGCVLIHGDNRMVELGIKQAELLLSLAKRPNILVQNLLLYHLLWGYDPHRSDKCLKVLVHDLRLNLTKVRPGMEKRIVTVREKGYYWACSSPLE